MAREKSIMIKGIGITIGCNVNMTSRIVRQVRESIEKYVDPNDYVFSGIRCADAAITVYDALAKRNLHIGWSFKLLHRYVSLLRNMLIPMIMSFQELGALMLQ